MVSAPGDEPRVFGPGLEPIVVVPGTLLPDSVEVVEQAVMNVRATMLAISFNMVYSLNDAPMDASIN